MHEICNNYVLENFEVPGITKNHSSNCLTKGIRASAFHVKCQGISILELVLALHPQICTIR